MVRVNKSSTKLKILRCSAICTIVMGFIFGAAHTLSRHSKEKKMTQAVSVQTPKASKFTVANHPIALHLKNGIRTSFHTANLTVRIIPASLTVRVLPAKLTSKSPAHDVAVYHKKVSSPQPKWKQFIATWYDGREGINGTGTGRTFSGAPVKAGTTVAVDPHVIPIGSTIEVKFQDGSEHQYKAEDTGGAIRGYHIDVFNPSYTQCIHNGVQRVLVAVLYVPHST